MAGAITTLDGLVSAETIALVAKATGGKPIEKLTPLKEQLGDRVSFEELHLIRVYRAR